MAKFQDVHIGKQLKVVSNLPGGIPAAQDVAYGFGPTAIPGTIWAEGGILIGSPLSFPFVNFPEASLMVSRAPLTNPLAAKTPSVFKVTTKANIPATPIDVMFGDPGVGIVGITCNTEIISIINASTIAIVSPTVTIATNKFHVGAQADAGAKTQAGAEARTGVKAKASKECTAGPVSTFGALTVTGLAKATAFMGDGKFLRNVPCTKSFDIPHPVKENHRLRHVCVEAPTADVYIRGKLDGNHIINLPDYWKGLVDHETISVNLTPIGKADVSLHVGEIREDKIILSSDHLTQVKCFYHVYAERKDVKKNIPEYEGSSPSDYPGDNTQYSIAGYNYDRRD